MNTPRLRHTIFAASVGAALAVAAAAAAVPCAARQSAPAASAPATDSSASQTVDGSYLIGPGDVVDIVVFKQPDYTQIGVRVGNDGMIPVARDTEPLRAGCRTASEVADELRRRYTKYLRNPFVTVSIKEFNSQPVAVIGAVNAPGRFQLQRPVRLLELLTLVNGPSPLAGDSVLVIHSDTAESCESVAGAAAADPVVTYRLDDTLNASAGANPYLAPGDIIRIPDADQAYVVGSVKSPKAIALRGPVTLTEAIAQAGGPLPDANRSKVRILRRTRDSATREEITVDLNGIAKRREADVTLRPDDIVDVPGPSGSTKFLGALKQILVPATIQYPLQILR